jgi:competence protein ComEA
MVRSIAGWIVVLTLVAGAGPAVAQQAPSPAPAAEAKTGKKADARADVKGDGVINLNTATQADLESLPGVGKSMAQRIVEYREKSGGFKKVEDLMNVKGIGEKSFLKLKTRLTVGAPKA